MKSQSPNVLFNRKKLFVACFAALITVSNVEAKVTYLNENEVEKTEVRDSRKKLKWRGFCAHNKDKKGSTEAVPFTRVRVTTKVKNKRITTYKYRPTSNPSRSARNACKNKLPKKGSINNLALIPSPSKFLTSGKTGAAMGFSGGDGLPPSLIEINDLGATNVFWKSGVIEGLNNVPPDTTQCSEFFYSSANEGSAGFAGCTMVEDVGYTFEPVLRSGTSICYAKNLPTQANLDQGVLTIVNGSLPDGQISKLFTAPAGTASRTVKLNFLSNGQNIQSFFVRLSGADTNYTSGNHFAYDAWSCKTDSQGLAVRDYETAAVLLNGNYAVTRSGNDAYGMFNATTSGKLHLENNLLEDDKSVSRIAQIKYLSTSGLNRFKAELEVSGDQLVKEKFFNLYRDRLSRKYLVAELKGNVLKDLKLNEGAFKESLQESNGQVRNLLGAIEYKGTGYRSSLTNSLLSLVSQADLTAPFYGDMGQVIFDGNLYSCNPTVDIELNFNLDNSAAQGLVSLCSNENKQVNNFCRENGSIMSAQNNYPTVCGS